MSTFTCSEKKVISFCSYLCGHLILWEVNVNSVVDPLLVIDLAMNRILNVLNEDLIPVLQSLVKDLTYWQVINPFILIFLSI